MTFTRLYTAIDNQLVDDQREMDRMDADYNYNMDYVMSNIRKMEA
jgi:hypothetical protein